MIEFIGSLQTSGFWLVKVRRLSFAKEDVKFQLAKRQKEFDSSKRKLTDASPSKARSLAGPWSSVRSAKVRKGFWNPHSIPCWTLYWIDGQTLDSDEGEGFASYEQTTTSEFPVFAVVHK